MTKSPGPRRVALASAIGTTVEWYDYFIFGTAAALVFGPAFFPELSSLAGLLASFSAFAVGFLARPLGAAIFGHFGDRRGRKPMMVLSLVLMGGATLAMGLLPDFDAIGVWAPVLLVALRLAQGIAVGGEWGAAALMSVEHSPHGKRGLYGSLPAVGAPAGILLSSAVFSVVSALVSDDDFVSWGWRIPFLLSVVLIALGAVVRFSIEESPEFTRQRSINQDREATSPLLEILRNHPTTVLIAAGTYIATAASFYVVTTWLTSYATGTVGLDRGTVLNVGMLASAASILAILGAGILSDRIGHRAMVAGGSIGFALYSIPFFVLVDTGNTVLFALAVVVAMIILSAIAGPVAALFAELFEVRIRYSGASLSFQLASVVGGGFTPLICTSLVAWTSSTWSISAYIIALNAIALLCVRAIPAPQPIPGDADSSPAIGTGGNLVET